MKPQRIVGMALGLIGFALIAWKAGWLTALGLMLAMLGNNLERDGDPTEDERG